MTSETTDLNQGEAAHPFALGLWAELRDRGEAGRRYVFDLLQVDLGLATLSGKKEVAAEALRRFMDARASEITRAASNQGSNAAAPWASNGPSRRSYDAFRADQPSSREWPSSSYIRNAFDNDWQAALDAVGYEPAVDVTSRQLTAAPKPYSRDEILTALRAWIAEVDEERGPDTPLLQAEYEAWVRARRSDDARTITRFPRASTLHRLIGDWREVLAALGCAHRHYLAQAPSAKKSRRAPIAPDELAAGLDLGTAPPDLPRKIRYVGPSSKVTRAHTDATIAWLRWLADQLPEDQRAALRMEDFDRYMASVRRLSLAQGKPLRPPSHASIERSPEIDGWLHAKHLAGMISGKRPIKRSTKAFSESEMVDAITTAVRELGSDMTRAQYTRWKSAETRRLPSASTLRRYFSDTGSWTVAIESVLRRADGQEAA